jgi:tetratricopeptide (TPR) repeat protein
LRGHVASVALLVALSWLTAIQPVSAQEAEGDVGRNQFLSGRSYYDLGEYENALREFERAQQLSGRPELYYNIYLCHQQLGNLEKAVEYLDKYLTEVPNVENGDTLRIRLENLRRRLAEQPAGETGATEPVAGGETGAPIAPPPPVDEGDAAAAEPTEPASGGGIPTPALISFAAAGAGVIAMALFGVLALSEQSSLEDGCGASMTCSSDDVSSLDTLALLSDIGLGVAVVGAALGVTFILTDDGGGSTSATTADTVRLSPFGVSGRF